ncbi:rhodanese-like domain-containing protein [Roseateles albus]|uniref:Rhodanese-like domain-containing protein n=1 Tax=Roseateles albus TaxID=2987525 RepID=A0ABT5KFG6_9BURK|nr:rhodanese-like domain-containing protein [Roseateles albus]MDC8772670.1 rhodanese-like domain-containing protein [Roseateles albus]
MQDRRLFVGLMIQVLTASLVTSLPARAQDKPQTPTRLAGGKVISPQEAHALMSGGKAICIDTRSPLSYAKGHIPGARLLAYKEKSEFAENFDAAVDSFDFEKLPPDKRTPLLFYSDGPTGWKSYKAAVLAQRRGYVNVHYLRSGWAGWEAAGLPKEE